MYLPRAWKLWTSNRTHIRLLLSAVVVSEQSWAGAAAPALLWRMEGTLHPAAATPGRRVRLSALRRLLYCGFGFGVIPAVFAIG